MSARTTDLLNAIEGISEAQDAFIAKAEKKIDSLTERLEEIEAKGTRPGKTAKDERQSEEMQLFSPIG